MKRSCEVWVRVPAGFAEADPPARTVLLGIDQMPHRARVTSPCLTGAPPNTLAVSYVRVLCHPDEGAALRNAVPPDRVPAIDRLLVELQARSDRTPTRARVDRVVRDAARGSAFNREQAREALRAATRRGLPVADAKGIAEEAGLA